MRWIHTGTFEQEDYLASKGSSWEGSRNQSHLISPNTDWVGGGRKKSRKHISYLTRLVSGSHSLSISLTNVATSAEYSWLRRIEGDIIMYGWVNTEEILFNSGRSIKAAYIHAIARYLRVATSNSDIMQLSIVLSGFVVKISHSSSQNVASHSWRRKQYCPITHLQRWCWWCV